MNTRIHLWIEPMVMNRQRCNDKVYFNCIINGDYVSNEKRDIEALLEGETMQQIMDYADIDCNWNYGVVSSKKTIKKPSIEFAPSPEDLAKEKESKKSEIRLINAINSDKPIPITKNEIEIKENGKIGVSLPSLNLNQEIDFSKIWAILERNVIGKIKEGETATFTDNEGNVLFEIRGGGYLNVGLADLSIYDAKRMDKSRSIFTHMQGLKGGLFVRDDGTLDIGDTKRTFWLRINTGNLLKASLRANKTLNELAFIKLIEESKK